MSEARIQLDAQVQVRRDIEANWAAVDPVLRDGEIAYSKDLNRIKVGDGARKWSELEYMAGSSASLSLDTEISDTSENAVQNKVIKAYVDGKAAEAQAAAEQYIQNEVLTYYATTKYVGEREEYIVGYAEGLVSDLEKEIDGRGYLTSAAMNQYATKDEIKNFVTKGTTLAHYGITDAVKWSTSISSSAPAEMGYGYPSKDWKTAGPAISFGTTGYMLRIQGIIADTDTPQICASFIYNGVAKGWAELLTVESLAKRDLDAQRLFLKGDTVLHRYGDTETYLNYGAATNDNASLLAYGTQFGAYTGSRENGYGLAFRIDADKTAYFYGGIKLGGKTITSWDEIAGSGGGNCITSDGGTINAGKYLKFGTNASLGVAATLDGYDKFVVSGLIQMSDLYITERLYFEKGCIVTFRNWNTGQSESISSFSDLKDILGLENLAYLKLTGGEINGSLIAKGVTGQDIDLRVTGDSYSLALRIGSGGTSRGLFDVTQNSWWIHRREDGYAIFNGESYYTGNLTAGGGLTLGGAKITSWSAIASYLALPYLNKNAALMPLNGFDNAGSLSISYLSNALYAASDRMEVELQGFSKTDPAGLFSGNYEQAYDVAAGTTGVLTISKSARLFADYPYGDTIVSFYYTYTPESVSVEVYDTSKGWQTLTLKERRGNHNGVYVFSNTSHYYVTQIRITVVAQAGQIARLVQIDHILSRGRLKELPVVTKFAIDQELYGRLICKGGITLGNKTITSWDDVKASGDYLPLAGGTITGNLTVSGLLTTNSGITLGGETINSWADVRSNWAGSTQTVNSGETTIEVVTRVKKSILTTLTNSHRLTFTLNNQNSSVPEWIIRFKTGSSVPSINISYPNQTLVWQNKQNILSGLIANTEYRIYIDGTLAMYETF